MPLLSLAQCQISFKISIRQSQSRILIKKQIVTNDVIKKEVLFKHPIEQVCNPITKAEEISTWFIPNDFKAEPRYQYTFTSPPNEKGCTVTSDKAKKAHTYILIYTWIVGGTKS